MQISQCLNEVSYEHVRSYVRLAYLGKETISRIRDKIFVSPVRGFSIKFPMFGTLKHAEEHIVVETVSSRKSVIWKLTFFTWTYERKLTYGTWIQHFQKSNDHVRVWGGMWTITSIYIHRSELVLWSLRELPRSDSFVDMSHRGTSGTGLAVRGIWRETIF